MLLKHSTASVFVLGWVAEQWQLGLMWHPRFSRWMLPGGHVETHENSAQAAVREVVEETGLEVVVLSTPSLVPAPGTAAVTVPSPLWIVEQHVPAEPRHSQSHIHVDHLYVAVATSPAAGTNGQHSFAWYSRQELARFDMFDGSRLLAYVVFDNLERLLSVAGAATVDASSVR